MPNRNHREIIGGHLLVIGGAEDKYNERRILRKFLHLAGNEKAEVLIVPVASDFPEFARWLVEQGITSISLNPDTAIKTALVIADEERRLSKQAASAA